MDTRVFDSFSVPQRELLCVLAVLHRPVTSSVATLLASHNLGENLEAISKDFHVSSMSITIGKSDLEHSIFPVVVTRRSDGQREVLFRTSGFSAFQVYDPVQNRCRRFSAVSDLPSWQAEGIQMWPGFKEGPVTVRDLFEITWPFVKPFVLLITGLAILAALMSVPGPFIIAEIFQRFLPNALRFQLLQIGVLWLCLLVGAHLISLNGQLLFTWVETVSDVILQSAVFERMRRLPADFYNRYSVGDMVNRAQGMMAIRAIFTGVVYTAFTSLIMAGALLVVLIHFSPDLAWVTVLFTLAVLVAYVLVALVQLRLLRKSTNQFGQAQGEATGIFMMLKAGMPLGDSLLNKWALAYREAIDRGYSASLLSCVMQTIDGVYPYFCTILLFFFAVHVHASEIRGLEPTISLVVPVGIFIGFLSGFNNFMSSVIGLIRGLLSMVTIIPIYQRLTVILREPVPTPPD